MKQRKCTSLRQDHNSGSTQITSTSLHIQIACRAVSWASWQRSQRGSSMIVLRTRFTFVGIALWQAHHIKFLTLFGTWRDHKPFQSFEFESVCCWADCSSDSAFKNLYLDLHVYLPSWEWGHINTSSIVTFPSGIFFIMAASSHANIPSINSSFHCLVSLISSATIEFSIDSIGWDSTWGGCFLGKNARLNHSLEQINILVLVLWI